MIFSLADWPGSFTDLVQSWIDVSSRHAASVNLLMGLYYAPPLWQATIVLTLAQALEAYHRIGFELSPASEAAAARKQRIVEALRSSLTAEDRRWLDDRLEHAEEPTLRKRVAEVASRVSGILEPMIPDPKRFANDLSDIRNTYSHFGAGGSGAESAVGDYRLARVAYWILIASIVLDLGFSQELARALITRNQRFQHDQQGPIVIDIDA